MSHWIWRFMGWLIALAVGAGVAYWVYLKQSNKALAYRVVSISPLGPLQARGFKDLKLFKGNRSIESPFLITIRIANSGDVSIAPGDFATPIEIKPLTQVRAESAEVKPDQKPHSVVTPYSISKFPFLIEGFAFRAQVVDARVAGTVPPQIPVDLQVEDHSLFIKPVLLNAGDEITVEMLISGRINAIEVSGRIAGIKRIVEEQLEEASPSNERARRALYVALAALIAGVYLALARNRMTPGTGKKTLSAISDLLAVVCLLALLYTLQVASFGSREFIIAIVGVPVLGAALAAYVVELVTGKRVAAGEGKPGP